MNDNDLYSFADDFEPEDFDDVERRFRAHEKRNEAMKNHPAGSKTKTTRLSDETNAYIGLHVLKFFFVILPLALLFTGIAVVPAIEAIFSTEIGYWTAFFLLMTIRWLILQPRNGLLLRNLSEQKGR